MIKNESANGFQNGAVYSYCLSQKCEERNKKELEKRKRKEKKKSRKTQEKEKRKKRKKENQKTFTKLLRTAKTQKIMRN